MRKRAIARKDYERKTLFDDRDQLFDMKQEVNPLFNNYFSNIMAAGVRGELQSIEEIFEEEEKKTT